MQRLLAKANSLGGIRELVAGKPAGDNVYGNERIFPATLLASKLMGIMEFCRWNIRRLYESVKY